MTPRLLFINLTLIDLLYEECLIYNFPEFKKVVDDNIKNDIGNLEHIIHNGELYFDTTYD